MTPSSPTLEVANPDAQAELARRLVMFSLALVGLGCAALFIDLPVAYAFVSNSVGPIWEHGRGGIQKLVQPGETFANGWGIVLLLMAMYAVDVARRRELLRFAVVVFSAGMLANVCKLFFARLRPKAFFDADADLFTGGVLEGFQGLLPLASLGYQGQSVPSGHTATAVALTIVLCRRWPHASWAFSILLGMAVIQRLAFGHHYPSDCCWGAALGCAIAAMCYHPRWAGQFFDRFESRRTVPTASNYPTTGSAVHQPSRS